MGQKSNPVGLRLQINRTWDSRWYAEGQDYGRLLLEDLKIRKSIMKMLPQAAISKVVIERPAKLCRISIYAARPGVIIGKKGSDIEKLKKTLGKMTSSEVSLNIVEIRKPEIDARLVAQGVADQLERRIAFRRAMKRAGRVWIRIFPDVPVSKKPAEVRMGSGKGAPEFWVCKIKPGRILFEVDGVSREVAQESMRLAACKLPIATRFVARLTA